MSISQADRIAFSSYQVFAPVQIKGILMAQDNLQKQIDKSQALDTANDNLFLPSNAMINQYQPEFNNIDGNGRTTITEQDIIDSANKKLQNHFFPNDTTQTVPSLAALGNVWPYLNPFALSYAIGKNYVESYSPVTPNENSEILLIQGYVAEALGSYTNIEKTTGQHSVGAAVPIQTFALVQTLSTNILAAVNGWKTALLAQAAAISAIVDSNTTNQANNAAALNNINNVIIPAINTWLAYPAFNPLPGGTLGAAFNATDPTPLAPTRLHSTELAALNSALLARVSFKSTRISQLNALLGSITQDLTNGNILTSNGFYGQRYSFLTLRLNALNGSLTILASLQAASGAQTDIISNIQSTAATYYSVLPTTAFQSNANGTQFISLVDVSFLSPGDFVYIMADDQVELQRVIKTVLGNAITLNDIVPAKYTKSNNVRLYKDLT